MIENLNDCEGVEQAKIGIQLLPKVYSNESNALNQNALFLRQNSDIVCHLSLLKPGLEG